MCSKWEEGDVISNGDNEGIILHVDNDGANIVVDEKDGLLFSSQEALENLGYSKQDNPKS